MPVSFGFHPYFQVPGPRSSWSFRLPDHDRIELDARGIPTGRRSPHPGTEAPVGTRTFDDLIALGPDRRFSLAGRGAGLEVVFDDAFSYAQLYLPPGAGFACIEPMVASVDALRRGECPLAEPGHPYEATFTLRPFTPQNP